MAAASAASDEIISPDKDAAPGEDSTSNEGAATDEGTAHETFINEFRPERLRSAAFYGPVATCISVFTKAYSILRGRLHDSGRA